MSLELIAVARQYVQADLDAACTALNTGVFENLYQVGRIQGRIDGLTAALAALTAAYQEQDDQD